MTVIVVVLAGALGAAVRYLVARRYASETFPWAILAVNVIGSGIGGAVLGLAERGAVSADIRLVILTGVCGGLTTFSTWSVETIQLVVAKKWRVALVNVASTLVLGIGVAALAYLITR